MVGALLVHGDAELGEELADPAVDVVDDVAHGVDVLACGVVDGPVLWVPRTVSCAFLSALSKLLPTQLRRRRLVTAPPRVPHQDGALPTPSPTPLTNRPLPP